jgi:zinc/manganese transport system substrate-binding protein
MKRAFPVAIAAVALAAAGCGGGGSDDAAADSGGKIAVVASTNVWGSVVAAVGGDDVSVTSLIDDPSADPHSYESKPEDATLLTDAKLVVYNGGGYDDFFNKIFDASGSSAKEIDAFAVSGHPEGENEHVWYEFATVKKVADKVADELGAIDPDNKDTYEANAKTFDGKVDELVTKAEALPDGKVVATEPVAHYLLDTAGMTDATPPEFSEAIEEETDPPVAVVADTTALITGKQVVALVNNDQTETPVTTQLNDAAKTAGVPVINVSETLPEGTTDYVVWMTDQLDAMAGALSAA